MNKKEHLTSSDYAYARLMEKMHKGDLLPGSSLNLKELREEFALSSTPLSNALIKMEAEGFVTVYPRSRVVVNKLEIHDFHLLYSIIGTIEYTLIADSIDAYTKPVIQELRAINKAMKEDILQHKMSLYDKHHYEFHEIFTTCNPSIFASRILDPIKARLWDFPRKNFLFDWYLQAINEHEEIISAIESKNLINLASVLKDTHWGYNVCKKFIQIEYNLEE